MQIRKANLKDFKEYYNLYKIENEEYSKIINTKIKLSPEKDSKKEFLRILNSKTEILLFATDEKLIGYIHGTKTKNLWGSKTTIEYVFVKKEYRKKGIGEELIKELAKITKSKKIDLKVSTKNKNAIGFYKKLKFNITNYYMTKVM